MGEIVRFPERSGVVASIAPGATLLCSPGSRERSIGAARACQPAVLHPY
jgi:hypothetical protein